MEVHLNKEMQRKLEILAEKSKKTSIFHVKKAITEYLKIHEMCQKDLFKEK